MHLFYIFIDLKAGQGRGYWMLDASGFAFGYALTSVTGSLVGAGYQMINYQIPPLKISGIKNRYNAVDGTFYDAIKFGGIYAI